LILVSSRIGMVAFYSSPVTFASRPGQMKRATLLSLCSTKFECHVVTSRQETRRKYARDRECNKHTSDDGGSSARTANRGCPTPTANCTDAGRSRASVDGLRSRVAQPKCCCACQSVCRRWIRVTWWV